MRMGRSCVIARARARAITQERPYDRRAEPPVAFYVLRLDIRPTLAILTR